MSDIKEISTNTENADLTASASGSADSTATTKNRTASTAKKTTSEKSASTAKKTTSEKSASTAKKTSSEKSASTAKKTSAKKAPDKATEAKMDNTEKTAESTATAEELETPITALLAESDDIPAEPAEQMDFDAYFKDFKETMSEALANVSEPVTVSSPVADSEITAEPTITEEIEPVADPASAVVIEETVSAEEPTEVATAETAEVSAETDDRAELTDTADEDIPTIADMPDNFVPDFTVPRDSAEAVAEDDSAPSAEPAEIGVDEECVADDGQISFDFESAKEVNDGNTPQKKRRDKNKFDPESPRLIDTVFEFVELFAFTFIAVLLITTFFLRYSTVKGGSMDKTLADGDNLIISNFLYTPERGDIIVFEDYSTELREPLVKRVIGIEGDTVTVDINGDVYVNGELLDEPYVYVTPGKDATAIFGTWTVGEGELFVLGDHRDISKDSREFGAIKADSVLGEVKLRFYPFEKFGLLD